MTYECYCAVVLSIVSFCESGDLEAVQADADWAREVSVRRKERAMVGVPDCHSRHAATLRVAGTPSVPRLGNRRRLRTGTSRAELSDAVTPTALFYYQFCTADLAYHFGEVMTARALLREAKERMQGIFGLPTTVELHFLGMRSSAAREHGLPTATPWGGRLVLRFQVRGALRKLRAWARSCPANFAAHALIRGGRARGGSRGTARMPTLASSERSSPLAPTGA